MSEATAYPGTEGRVFEDEADAAARFWWVFLFTGSLWLLFSVVLLRFDYTSVSSISILFGCVMIAAGVMEAVAVFVVRGWARLGHGLLALVCLGVGVVAFIHPGNTFRALAGVMSIYLVVKGTLSVIFALADRKELELWWLRLTIGVVEVLVGFWAAGYWGRSSVLLVAWVGVTALTRGITEIVMAFSLRRAERA
jgi:uncharacterized membrane protein HdeD (DUF308 family)